MARPNQLTPESQFPEEALAQSVQKPPDVISVPTSMVFTWNIATAADAISPWGKNIGLRDRQLREFWPSESFLAGAIVNTSFRNAAYDWEIRGASPKVEQVIADIIKSAIAGDSFGWTNFVKKFSQDLYCQDNGAFVELIRDPGEDANSKFKEERAPVIGIAHMDANQCLSRDTRILFEDGSTMSILDVVRHKYGGYVMSLGKDGKLEPKRITAFYETSLGNRYWLKIGLKSPQRHYAMGEAISLTNDHEIYSDSGWKRADGIKPGDKIATGNRKMSRKQMEIVIGTMLGDGFISKHQGSGNWSSIRLCHCKEQEEWFNVKRNALLDFGFSSVRTNRLQQHSSESLSDPFIGELRNVFYPEGKKIVPRELFEKYFSPRLMAAWYLDDGNKQTGKWGRPKGRIYTQSFSVDDVQWLVDFLNEKGIDCLLKTSGIKKQPWIYVTVDGFEKMAEMISEYVPPSMRYKLPEESKPYNPSLWELTNQSEVFFDEVVSVERIDNGGQTLAFCIDVEDNHNFIAAGMVVHNCTRTGDPKFPVIYTDRKGKDHKLTWYQVIPFSDYPSAIERMNGVGVCAVTRSLRLAQIMRSIFIFKDEKVSGRHYKSIHMISGVSKQDIKDIMKLGKEDADNAGQIRYIDPAILASLDPEKPVSTATIDLANLPDGFDFDEEMKWYISGLALCFGVDYQEFAPLPGGAIGSSNQSMILSKKSSGKGPAMFMKIAEAFKNYGVLPRDYEMIFEDRDEQRELDKATLRKTFQEEMALALRNGFLTPDAAREIGKKRGFYTETELSSIPKEYGEDMLLPKQNIGNTGGNTIAEDAGRTGKGAPESNAGAALRKEEEVEKTGLFEMLRKLLSRREKTPDVHVHTHPAQLPKIEVYPTTPPAPRITLRPNIIVKSDKPEVTVNVPEQPAPVVNIAPANVTVNVPEQPAPVVNVKVPKPVRERQKIIRDASKNMTGTETTIDYEE